MKIHNIKYSFDRKKSILKKVFAEFEVGKIYVIPGISGCGKTVLFSISGGLGSPSEGQVLF